MYDVCPSRGSRTHKDERKLQGLGLERRSKILTQFSVLDLPVDPLQASRWTHNVLGGNLVMMHAINRVQNYAESHFCVLHTHLGNYERVKYYSLRPMWVHPMVRSSM